MRRTRTNACMFGLLAVIGCGPIGPGQGEETSGASSSGEAVTTGGTTGAVPTTGGATTDVVLETTGGSTAAASTTSESSGGEQTFIDEPETTGDLECDNWAQNCPPGHKCSAYAEGGGTSWNALKCVPVMEDPAGVGEECFVVGNGVSGIDNCDFGSYCWDTNAENVGVCVALCTGSPESPMCPPKFTCAITGSGVINLCLKGCDPLLQDCLMTDDLCLSSGDGFLCVLDASGEEGQVHDPCEYANACDPGLACIDVTAADECDPAAGGCCEPFCDVNLPNTCPGQGQVCESWFGEGMGPPEYAHIGVCAVPA